MKKGKSTAEITNLKNSSNGGYEGGLTLESKCGYKN